MICDGLDGDEGVNHNHKSQADVRLSVGCAASLGRDIDLRREYAPVVKEWPLAHIDVGSLLDNKLLGNIKCICVVDADTRYAAATTHRPPVVSPPGDGQDRVRHLITHGPVFVSKDTLDWNDAES